MITWVFLVLASTSLRSEERFITERVSSSYLKGERTIRIYLPASYVADPKRRYPVLYLHDGQNVYSSAGTNVAFGWGNWELDKTADALSRTGQVDQLILVAVDNSPARYAEYCGSHSSDPSPKTAYENYSDFLIKELKPNIDQRFRTRPDPEHTGVLGSSMGGICSLALAWDHPEVFGRAASLSGAFMVERTNFVSQTLQKYSGPPKPFRIYLDSGTCDFMGGDDGRNLTGQVAHELARIGWGKELRLYVDEKPLNESALRAVGLRVDKWAEAQRSQHNEFYWRLRVWRALAFLFPANGTDRQDSK